jgi:Fe-S-cluster containining protein
MKQGDQPQKNSCGQCTLCCTYLRIDSKLGYTTRIDTGEDLAKEAGVRCRYLSDQGCSIYQARPAVCRRFICDWRAQKNPKEHEYPLVSGYIQIKKNKIKAPF